MLTINCKGAATSTTRRKCSAFVADCIVDCVRLAVTAGEHAGEFKRLLTGNKPGLACNSLMNELHQYLVFERFCKEAESSRIECGLAH